MRRTRRALTRPWRSCSRTWGSSSRAGTRSSSPWTATAGSGRSRPHGTTPRARRSTRGRNSSGSATRAAPRWSGWPSGAGATPSVSRGESGRGDLDFSFSGLKTSLRYRVQAMSEAEVGGSLAGPLRELPGGRGGRSARRRRPRRSPAGVPEPRALGGCCQQPGLTGRDGAVAAEAGVRFLAARPGTPATTPP